MTKTQSEQNKPPTLVLEGGLHIGLFFPVQLSVACQYYVHSGGDSMYCFPLLQSFPRRKPAPVEVLTAATALVQCSSGKTTTFGASSILC